MRTTHQWLDIIEKNGTNVALAEHVTSDLVGYRKTSLSRSNDVDNLVNLFLALRLNAENKMEKPE